MSTAPIKLSQNGKKPGPGTQGVDQRVAERCDKGGEKDAAKQTHAMTRPRRKVPPLIFF